jgi:poly(3-hydroxybutyrate) depolymerase
VRPAWLALALLAAPLACSRAGEGAAGDAASVDGDAGVGGAAKTGGGADSSEAGGAGGAAEPPDGAQDAARPVDMAADTRPDAVPGGGSSLSRQTARPLGSTAAKNGFWEYLPPGYGDRVPRPLLVFWHGLSGNGSGSVPDLARVATYGPPGLIALNQWPASRPFVVLSPQHAPTTAPLPAGTLDCPPPDEMRDFFAFALASYDVDPARVYLTGLSCGALGGSEYLGRWKGEQVAAAVLIAGDASTAFRAAGCALLADVALWAFHGGADTVVSIAADNQGMMGFLACPRPHRPVDYTVYPGVDHGGAWVRTYDLSAGHDVYAWLLAQHR